MLFVVVAFGGFYLAVIGVMLYGFGAENKIVKLTTKYVPYPAAVVSFAQWITFNEMEERLTASRHFYENQNFGSVGLRVDFSTEDGQKRLKIREREVLNKMVENKIIEILLAKNKASISSAAIDQEVSRKLSAEGSWQETDEKLARLYGWTLADFKEKIVKPDLQQKKLAEIFRDKYSASQNKRKKIEEAEQALSAKDFAAVAREFSEGLTAADGGALGWFKKEQLIAGLTEKVFSLEAGKISEIVETELGYHIVKVEERQTEDAEELVRISQIFVRKNDFADWLEKEMQTFKIRVPAKDYQWDEKTLSIQFANSELQEFEKKAVEEFQGDASVLN